MNISTFQLILLSIFGFAIFLGVMIFSGAIPGFRAPSGGELGTVVMWGPLPERAMSDFTTAFNKTYKSRFNLIYVAKTPETLESELISALASGAGPDLVIFPSEIIYRQSDKFLPIPYDTISLRDFRDTFVESGEVFLAPEGSLALPILVDPLVSYFNRDLLSSAGVAVPPAKWSDYKSVAQKINRVEQGGVIRQTALALGSYSNIKNAKHLFSLLALQAGTPITQSVNGEYRSFLADSFGGTLAPGQAALDFFTQFANPSKSTYSWNRSLPEARDAFAAGLLATYFGFSSELSDVRAKNPNLNFDVGVIPQRDQGKQLTLAKVYGLGILRQSRNLAAAAEAAVTLAGPEVAPALSAAAALPPARRDLLAAPAGNDPLQAVFYRAAVMSVSWLDPDPAATERIFAATAERVVTGQQSPYESVSRANSELNDLFKP